MRVLIISSENFNLKVTENPEELETQDYIIIGVKAHAIANIVEGLKPLLNKYTAILSDLI